jgi:FkbM family methyltransferase
LKLRQRLKKWVYGKCPGFAGAVPYYGARVYFPKGSLIFHLLCEQGIYEGENLKVINSLVDPGTTYIDVGANIGLMAVPVLNYQDCSVISFEPSPNVLPFLERTASESQYRNRWKVIGKAAGDRIGETQFFASMNGKHVFDGVRDTKRSGAVRATTVPVTTLDSEWEDAGRPRVSVIKIDVEGAELQILEGARQCLEANRPYILIEWNEVNLRAFQLERDAILKCAQQMSYELFSVPAGIRLDNLVALKLQMLAGDSFLMVPKEKLGSPERNGWQPS